MAMVMIVLMLVAVLSMATPIIKGNCLDATAAINNCQIRILGIGNQITQKQLHF